MRAATTAATLAAVAALAFTPGAASANTTTAVSAGTTTAAAPCGGTTTFRINPYTKVRTWKLTWTNCAKGSRKKIDIARGPDLTCYYIPGGSSRTWWFESAVQLWAPYPRGFKNC
ncbi:hypothetical protein HII36_41205 [Nonomuraea sp. NN258]|uniref:hypothetical protein n=1 Tax=Nonomuraea antri TaxID=2730852 RepID=UPI001568317B|nr:hypothetical protein [Nonomuraea antri]NRQ38205.1 hypothetical protein [Nonomuraea antri]